MPISARARKVFAIGLGDNAAAKRICDIADAGTTGTVVSGYVRGVLASAIGNRKEANTIADCCTSGAAVPANCRNALAIAIGNRGVANEIVTAINAIN